MSTNSDSSHPTNQAPDVSGNTQRVLAIAVAIALAIFILGALTLQGLDQHHETLNTTQLKAIVSLKADQIEFRIEKRLRDAKTVQATDDLHQLLGSWKDTQYPVHRQSTEHRLSSIRQTMGYQAVSFVDSGGQRLLGVGSYQPTSPALRTAVAEAISGKKVIFSDLYAADEGAQRQLYVDVIVPIAAERGAALVMRSDEGKFLFSLLHKWPLPSETAESLLF